MFRVFISFANAYFINNFCIIEVNKLVICDWKQKQNSFKTHKKSLNRKNKILKLMGELKVKNCQVIRQERPKAEINGHRKLNNKISLTKLKKKILSY